MKIISSQIFERFDNLIFGMSAKIVSASDNFSNNMSLSINDDPERVLKNRKTFFENLGLQIENVAYQKQIHGDKISYVTEGGFAGQSDALTTDKTNLGIAISTADCVAVFIYDVKEKVIAGIHSGWRGTELKIVRKSLKYLNSKFNSQSENLNVYLAPSISQRNYEVGREVAIKFKEKYILRLNGKMFLDVAQINYDALIDFGIPAGQIEKSELCSFDTQYLHSYRRDGKNSGRAFAMLAMRGKY
ncbi:MAG: peptidoglycan editing factor PgeF [Chlorobi bacterium]|nr:peptidoglycan editing factor PgeF [Chlorobiota bacterium]